MSDTVIGSHDLANIKAALGLLAQGIAQAAQHAGYSGVKKLPAQVAELLGTAAPASVGPTLVHATLDVDFATPDERRRFSDHPEQQAAIAEAVNRRAAESRAR